MRQSQDLGCDVLRPEPKQGVLGMKRMNGEEWRDTEQAAMTEWCWQHWP